tara:strand:+ start:506 stop:790 length:285 start_codon:yes stop_codon:yes gene_type:complete
MPEPYIPKVNDYVIWDKGEYGRDEGWVYFYSEEYITIETGVRPKPPEQIDCRSTNKHKMIHTLLLCHAAHWNELQYVKSRTPYDQIEHYSQCDD